MKTRRRIVGIGCFAGWMAAAAPSVSAGGSRGAGLTTLTNTKQAYRELPKHAVTMDRGPLRIVVVDNAKHGEQHRAGYNGLASLVHKQGKGNVFVPLYAGLNFELIHDGTKVPRDRMMEPRRAPMSLRRIDAWTVELHQPPTPTWHLESCTRFRLLDGGAVEMAFECIPRRAVFKRGFIGLFWASYMDRPESKAIHFRGVPRDAGPDARPRWIEAVTPKHGVDSTHVGLHDRRDLVPAPDFPVHYMVFSYSAYRYTEPFYYGVTHGIALGFVFRKQDQIRFTQSPTGGGADNPAWDFQFMIPDPGVGKASGFVMRLVATPLEDRDQFARGLRRHVAALADSD